MSIISWLRWDKPLIYKMCGRQRLRWMRRGLRHWEESMNLTKNGLSRRVLSWRMLLIMTEKGWCASLTASSTWNSMAAGMYGMCENIKRYRLWARQTIIAHQSSSAVCIFNLISFSHRPRQLVDQDIRCFLFVWCKFDSICRWLDGVCCSKQFGCDCEELWVCHTDVISRNYVKKPAFRLCWDNILTEISL